MLAFVNAFVSFAPTRVEYSNLKSDTHELREILERDGVVAITDVPGFKTAREEALGAASRCVATHPGASSRTFHDGTKRRTPAATPETKMPASLDGTPCATFEAAATSLRAATADATAAFSAALGRAVDLPAPLLDADDEDVTISQMLDNAEVLEHFHSYTLPRAAAPPTGDGGVPTVDVHTDQGDVISASSRPSTPGAGSRLARIFGFGASSVEVRRQERARAEARTRAKVREFESASANRRRFSMAAMSAKATGRVSNAGFARAVAQQEEAVASSRRHGDAVLSPLAGTVEQLHRSVVEFIMKKDPDFSPSTMAPSVR